MVSATVASFTHPHVWHSPAFGRSFERRELVRAVGTILLGCGAFGFTIGAWRGVELGTYVAIKLPLVILFTVACNGFLNGIFSQLLGSGLGFRQSVQALLESYRIFAVIVGSLAPISAGLAWQLATTMPDNVNRAHAFLLVFHTAFIAYAGLVAHLRMFRALLQATGRADIAAKTFLAWSVGNLIAGAQIAYALRPYAGTPGLPVTFLRQHPMEGNFYQAIWHMVESLAKHSPLVAGMILGACLLVGGFWLRASMRFEIDLHHQSKPKPTKP